MNKYLVFIIRFILDFIIVGLVPVLIVRGVAVNIAASFSFISFMLIHIRQWFVNKYETNVV